MSGYCICADVRRTTNRTEVVFVRHHYETFKSTNTARIAALVLESSRIVEVGCDVRAADRELSALGGGFLLYPDAVARRSFEPPPERLFVLDGTWAQSRRMLRKLTALHQLPRVSLPPATVVMAGLRESPRADARSTIHAVADALELLEGSAMAEPLREAARLHTERVLVARGAPNRFTSPGL